VTNANETTGANTGEGIEAAASSARCPVESADDTCTKEKMTDADESPSQALLEATYARRCKELHVKFYKRVGFWVGAVSYISGTAALGKPLSECSRSSSVIRRPLPWWCCCADLRGRGRVVEPCLHRAARSPPG
jgi:hypothetical protein